jgi:hypothetical protein
VRPCAIALALLACGGATVQAQSAPGESARFEIGVGVSWNGQSSFGTRAANETTATGGALALFSTETSLSGAAGVEARFGVRLTRRIDVDAVAAYARPRLLAVVRSDSEAGAGPFTAAESIQQFAVGGAAVWRLAALQAHPKWTPFATAGVQYFRELHEGQLLVVAGPAYEAGGGVKYLPRSRVGIRADARAIVRTAAVNIDGRAHVSPAIAASLFIRF